MDLILIIDHLAPTIGVMATGWFGYRAAKSGNLNKSQFRQISSEMSDMKKSIEHIKRTGDDNNQKIDDANDKLELHTESHLGVMYRRLEIDIKHALERGYTSGEEFSIIARMYKNYRNLGGNGYITRLYQEYQTLKIKD